MNLLCEYDAIKYSISNDGESYTILNEFLDKLSIVELNLLLYQIIDDYNFFKDLYNPPYYNKNEHDLRAYIRNRKLLSLGL